MNIGIVVGRFPPDLLGGAELQAKQMAEQLAKHKHNVVVFTRRYNNRPYQEKVDGYTIYRRDEVPIPGLRVMWDTVPAVYNIARCQPQPEVLLCYQTLNSGLIGMVAQAMLKIPLVLSVRGNREYRLQNSTLQRLIVPPIYKRAKRIIVQSERIRDDMYEQFAVAGQTDLVNCLPAKTVVIPNGITMPEVTRSRGNKILYVGRLIKNKGVADLINGMQQLPDSNLVIVGDGPDRPRLEQLAENLPVKFVGRVPAQEVYSHLGQARVLVLPSHLGDGFPNVILEAMACGVPVVATNTAGIPDLVRHAQTGYLFEVANIDQMVGYIKQILTDDHLWEKLGQTSLDTVQTYAWDQVTPQVENLLGSFSKS